jgi:RNA-binding protein NOB1
MSRTDLKLAALALDCCEAKGCLGARVEPRNLEVNPGDVHSNVTVVTEEVSDDESTSSSDAKSPSSDSNEEERQEDSDGDWITPENIHQVSEGRVQQDGVSFAGDVACVTSDFALQNVLMHLGVPIVGPQGMQIRELRLWLLRCHACYRLVSDTTRQFCPDCGSGNTLKRVNYVVNTDGEKQLFINFKRRINTRGTVYNLPKPRGGKFGTNRTLALREDQLAHVIKGSSSHTEKRAKVLEDSDELATFGETKPQKRFDHAQPKTFSSYKLYNVNERKKARAARRK